MVEVVAESTSIFSSVANLFGWGSSVELDDQDRWWENIIFYEKMNPLCRCYWNWMLLLKVWDLNLLSASKILIWNKLVTSQRGNYMKHEILVRVELNSSIKALKYFAIRKRFMRNKSLWVNSESYFRLFSYACCFLYCVFAKYFKWLCRRKIGL